MTKFEIINRINILSDEIESNEEENYLMREEINKLYDILDGEEYYD